VGAVLATQSSVDGAGGEPETFDETAFWETAVQRVRRIRTAGWVIGPLLVVGGALLLFIFSWGPGSATFGERVDPFFLIGFGGCMILSMRVVRSHTVVSATLDDLQLRLNYSGGKVVNLRWDEPDLVVTLRRVSRAGPSEPTLPAGWAVSWLGAGRQIHTALTLAASDGLIRRARRLGLALTTNSRALSWGAPGSRLEEITIRRGGSEPLPRTTPGTPI
jgi:hypothetical protein